MAENKLTKDDIALFEEMRDKYVSENERLFFETLNRKQRFEPSYCAEQLILENDNHDQIYLLRLYWEEYIIGSTPDKENPSCGAEIHTMDLSEALAVNMKRAGLLDRDITFHEWLRSYEYRCLNYNRNLDLL